MATISGNGPRFVTGFGNLQISRELLHRICSSAYNVSSLTMIRPPDSRASGQLQAETSILRQRKPSYSFFSHCEPEQISNIHAGGRHLELLLGDRVLWRRVQPMIGSQRQPCPSTRCPHSILHVYHSMSHRSR